MMWHFGQTAETMSSSRDSSAAQPVSFGGSGLAAPPWLTWRKQVVTGHAASPYVDRYFAMSAAADGSL